ncbi:hypothetical protein ACFSBZ_05210 [Amnibacterium flavum]|uniref:Cell wall protein n=1 Tax=Amnibacterium flavum TaxID=2173173 RepID=A0A2V1HVF9_9MICO|nr:hypothetical protein [Amnibacterium flavum]PVZ94124.1 hypothetical protein DDQ50_10265 [Amnibacterium flavum]
MSWREGQRIAVYSITTVCFALASLTAAAPADAASEPLLVSTDGSTWSPAISEGLFSGDLRVIPGGEYTRTFWVMSNVDGALDLTVDVCGVTASDPDFAASVSLASATATTPVGSPVALGSVTSADGCALILPAEALSDGVALPVDVTLRMAADSSSVTTADASIGFEIRVQLTESIDGPADGSGGSGLPGGPSGGSGAGSTNGSSSTGTGGARTPVAYSVTVPGGGLGEVETRAFPAETDPSTYSDFGDAGRGTFTEVALQPATIGGIAILIGILAAFMLLFVGHSARTRRHDPEDLDDTP